MLKHKIRDDRGATLIEVMICVVVFVIGMTGLLDVVMQSKTMGKRAEYAYTSYNLAKNHIERLRRYSFTNLASAQDSGTVLTASDTEDPTGPFTRTTTITTNYNGDANTTMATVTVAYTIRGVQNASQCQLSYIFFNNNGSVG